MARCLRRRRLFAPTWASAGSAAGSIIATHISAHIARPPTTPAPGTAWAACDGAVWWCGASPAGAGACGRAPCTAPVTVSAMTVIQAATAASS